MKQLRLILWSAAALAAVALAGLLYFTAGGPQATAIGGPFRLKDQNGRIVDTVALKGKPYAIFFGFTHCPEICPTTMADMAALMARLGPEAKDFRIYFVSVDPERDTPEVLRSYLASFEPNVVGLTGTPDEIAKVAKEFRVYYRKVPLDGGDYTMDHSAFVYLMGKDGGFRSVIGYQEKPDRALDKLKTLIEKG
ncbi:MAG TPA: SCO family protein [Beijerinckiaceae bacterium]|nr:SCO family protein [Beijerinckiaceae bacterium]